MKSMILDPTQKPEVFTEAYKTGKSPNWDEVFEGYDAAVDWPSSIFWEDLMNYYPNAKIILTTRDAAKWYDSVKSTVYQMSDELVVPPRVHEIRSMILAIVKDGELKDFAEKENMMQQFNEHTEKVKKIVPADRLLIFQPGDGWEPLCRFLGVDVPKDIPYPHLNKKDDFQKMAGKLFDMAAEQESKVVGAQV